MKKTLLTIIALFVSMVAMADAGGEIGNLTWHLNSSTHTLTISGTGDMINLYGPDYPWFWYDDEIQHVIVENGVTSIGSNAFHFYTYDDEFYENLTSVTIANSVVSIGDYAFSNDPITSLTLSNSLAEIGEYAFYGAFITSLAIPNSVTTIEHNAFAYCIYLQNVTMGNFVTTLGSNSFYGCSSLTSVTLSSALTSLEGGMFGECYSLTNIPLPQSLTTLGDGVFAGCSSLTNISLPLSLTTIGLEAFKSSGIQSITIPQNVNYIGTTAFDECFSLTSVTYKAIAATNCRFSSDCPITNVTISNDVHEIPDNFMTGITTLTTLTMGNNVTKINSSAFYNCDLTGDLTLGNALVQIGSSAFRSNYNLESVVIPSTVTEIGGMAFYDTDIYYVVMMPTTPPSMDVFTGFNFDSTWGLTMEVPCGSKPAYEQYLSYPILVYPNFEIIESSDCTYTIAATAEPANGGTISGTGTYNNGDYVTLKATPKSNYIFEKWTENGTTVSTNATYSFTCNGNRTLKAHFKNTTGIGETENVSIAIFPNPTDGIVNIECEGMTDIEVYSCDGKLVQKLIPCDDNIQIDFSETASGIYYLNIISKVGNVRKSIIKR